MPPTGARRRQELAPRRLEEPHPDRLPRDHPDRDEVLRRHSAAIAAGRAGYPDPATGRYVITAQAHAARGFCCGSGCRHCPYV